MNNDVHNNAGNGPVEAAEGSAAAAADVPESSAGLDELRRENEELRNAARIRLARELLSGELSSLGARSPSLIADAAAGELQFDGSGDPVNIAALVAVLRARYPEQFGEPGTPGSVDAAAGAGRRTEVLTPEKLARMKPAEIARLDWADVRNVLANG